MLTSTDATNNRLLALEQELRGTHFTPDHATRHSKWSQRSGWIESAIAPENEADSEDETDWIEPFAAEDDGNWEDTDDSEWNQMDDSDRNGWGQPEAAPHPMNRFSYADLANTLTRNPNRPFRQTTPIAFREDLEPIPLSFSQMPLTQPHSPPHFADQQIPADWSQGMGSTDGSSAFEQDPEPSYESLSQILQQARQRSNWDTDEDELSDPFSMDEFTQTIDVESEAIAEAQALAAARLEEEGRSAIESDLTGAVPQSRVFPPLLSDVDVWDDP